MKGVGVIATRRGAGLLAALLLGGAAGAQAPATRISAEQLVELLSAPMPAARPLTRSLTRSMAALPDPASNLCLADGAPAPAPAATRNLYVSAAPKVDLDVHFAYDSARLGAQTEPLLDALGAALQSAQLQDQRFVIAGHTDKQGADDYNKRLSCARALSVRDYLLRRHGIDPARLVALGFGFERLLDVAEPTADVNRRVEIRKF